jgi:protoheme IX farnesyltransferase
MTVQATPSQPSPGYLPPLNAEAAGIGDASVGDYFALLKPRVMSLVIFTALVGMMVAPGSLHPVLLFSSLLAIGVGAGASGALNMWYDADIDGLMGRTAKRPIPNGRVLKEEAAGLGIALSLFAVLALALAANLLAAGLLAFTIFFYAVVYTMWLKRRTPQNIVIGGAAGALPPVIGWAAATGHAPLAAWSLFLVIFMWTPPHFWALALCRSGEYERAGIPMMPNAQGERSTRRQIVLYAVLLAASTALPPVLGVGGILYVGIAAICGIAFVALSIRLWLAKSDIAKRAMSLFKLSTAYLFLMFAALLVERLAHLPPLAG